jgi:hypothetical protein
MKTVFDLKKDITQIYNDKKRKVVSDLQNISEKIFSNTNKIVGVEYNLDLLNQQSILYSVAIANVIFSGENENEYNRLYDMVSSNLVEVLFSSESDMDLLQLPVIDEQLYIDPTNSGVFHLNDPQTPIGVIDMKNKKPENRENIRVPQNYKNKKEPSYVFLTDEINMKYGQNPTNLGSPYDIDNYNNGNVLYSKGLYYNSKMKLYTKILISTSLEIEKINTEIIENLESNKFESLYVNIIPNNIFKLLNIGYILCKINNEIDKISKHVSNIRNFFSYLYDEIPDVYSFLREQINEYIAQSSKDIDKLSGDIENLYKTTKKEYNLMNDVISFINSSSVEKCFNGYYDDEVDFDIYYQNNMTSKLEFVYDRELEKLRDYPNSLTDFMKLIDGDELKTRKNLIIDFIPRITLENSPNYFKNENNKKPTKGFLGTKNVNNYLMYIGDDINIDDIKTTSITKNDINVTDDDVTDQTNDDLIGYIGFIDPKRYDKSEKLPPIIGKYLGDHLVMLKQIIIRWIIEKCYILMNKQEEEGEDLIKQINKIKESTSQIINIESDDSFIYTLISKYIDSILIQFITDNANISVNNILNLFTEKEQKENSINLLTNILTRNSDILLPSENITYSLDLNEVFDDLMSSYKNTSRNVLMMGNLRQHKNEEEKNNIHEIVNYNYEIKTTERICFEIDIEIIEMLLKNGANINQQDNMGNTPIFYAIDMKNIDLVKTLMKNNALVNIDKYKNINGITPLKYAYNEYIRILNRQMINKYDICENITKNMITEFKKKSQFNNNIPKYTKILLSMALYMLEHQIYITGKGYPNGWSFENNANFEHNLSIYKNDVVDILPVLKNINKESILNNDAPDIYVLNLTKEKEIKKSLFDELMFKRDQMSEENKYIPHDDPRGKELTENLTQLKSNIKNLLNEINLIDTKISSTNDTDNQIDHLLQDINANRNHIESHSDVVKIYDSIFNNVLNENHKNQIKNNKYPFDIDVKTYPKIWKNYLNKKPKDHTQVINNIFNYQKSMSNSGKDIVENINKLSLVNDYSTKVINPFIKDYFELPSDEYNTSNYPLTQIMDIIIHIVKRIIFVGLYGSIIKNIVKIIMNLYPKSQFAENDYNVFVVETTKNVISDISNKSKIIKYIFHEMPVMIVKNILKIYEGINGGEDDMDRLSQSENIIKYFLKINTLLEENTTLSISEKSLLTNNLKDYVYPFYVEYVTMAVSEMKNTCDNYLKSFKYQHLGLNILIELNTNK